MNLNQFRKKMLGLRAYKTGEHVPLLKINLLANLYHFVGQWGILPFNWNADRDLLEPTNFRRFEPIFRQLRLRYFVCLLLQIAYWFVSKRNGSSMMEVLQNATVALSMTAMFALSYASYDKSSETIVYVNGLRKFISTRQSYKKEEKGNVSLIEVLNVSFACGICVAGFVAPGLLAYGLHWKNACKATLVGYWMIPECSDANSKFGWINSNTKLVLMLGNHFLVTISAQASLHVVAGLQCLGNMILLDCQKIFWIQLENERIPSRMRKASLVFREVQILGNLSNSIQDGIMTTSLLSASIIGHALSFCATILLVKVTFVDHGIQAITSLALFASITVVTVLVIIVTFGGMSKVFQESKIIFWEVKWHKYQLMVDGVPGRVRSWQFQFFRSWFPVKIRFGANNFVEELTPLNAASYSLGLVVQLLLVK